ncbi:MAG: hypothetical protein H8E66_02030 [Planctomycetes bacterium]|nr:hypothetical protein [Planctomycetota bacterium]
MSLSLRSALAIGILFISAGLSFQLANPRAGMDVRAERQSCETAPNSGSSVPRRLSSVALDDEHGNGVRRSDWQTTEARPIVEQTSFSAALIANVAVAQSTAPAIESAQLAGKTVAFDNEPIFVNSTSLALAITWTQPILNARRAVVYRTGDVVLGSVPGSANTSTSVPISNLREGPQEIFFQLEENGSMVPNSQSSRIRVVVRTRGPRVIAVEPANFGTAPGVTNLTIRFNSENPVAEEFVKNWSNYQLLPSDGTGRFNRGTEKPLAPSGATKVQGVYDPVRNSVRFSFPDIKPDVYQLTVGGTNITDLAGNKLEGAEKRPGTDYVVQLGRLPLDTELADTPSVRPGITGSTGAYVPYTEFTKPRTVPEGFNPHDKVETRVSRLYFYRDAHRVAQIINRKVKSHNRQGVDMARQLADKTRHEADQTTESRKEAERSAIAKAQRTRRLENQQQAAQNSLNRSIQELTNARRQGAPADDPVVQQLAATAEAFDTQVRSLQGQIEEMRDEDVAANDLVRQLEGQERLARQEQFRREVAAAHADPDTYAPGVPSSQDPVEQVSVSVIGEGLIQLRGPLKGINTIRTMIDQIDSPVGQVRVAVHSVQINGERAERMEVVADEIQKYIDHSRFLTMQSAEMLRKAVVQVAARRAQEAGAMYPGHNQKARDQRYLYAFFGKDFTDELAAMDSEFLHTGNKLLSLHSMDVTSLSSALNLLALANNDTRREILAEFDGMTGMQLPMAEERYLEAGYSCTKQQHSRCGHPTFCLLGQNAKFESLRGFFNSEITDSHTMTPLQREFLRLAQIFKSRLITEMEYKQRVTERAVIEERRPTELEQLNLRVLEKERTARETLERAHIARRNAVKTLLKATMRMQGRADEVSERVDAARQKAQQLAANYGGNLERYQVELDTKFKSTLETLNLSDLASERVRHRVATELKSNPQPSVVESTDGRESHFEQRVFEFLDPEVDASPSATEPNGASPETAPAASRAAEIINQALRWVAPDRDEPAVKAIEGAFRDGAEFPFEYGGTTCNATAWLDEGGGLKFAFVNEQDKTIFEASLSRDIDDARQLEALLRQFNYSPRFEEHLTQGTLALQAVETLDAGMDSISELTTCLKEYHEVAKHVSQVATKAAAGFASVSAEMAKDDADYSDGSTKWRTLAEEIQPFLKDPLLKEFTELSGEAIAAFDALIEAQVDLRFAVSDEQAARRPLDHKKLLDMLIDDLEEKYIELLEGTRAHTANVDNYLKRLTTALDDDFNTQFYYPAFRHVREASQYYDVQFGQTETTSILANNRAFAKVSPAASMEFDLPKRDILISEAMNGAKATIDDIGALANDPTFLAMANLKSGGSTASPPPGSTGGYGVVRDVLPGLNSSTSEQIMSQNANGGNQFGSNLENLIPDPAIYKFETGTGYEIRPVIQPDGQAVVFDFNYMYTTQIREPVRADEKHLGRVKQHFIDTDVQLSNFELREVSRYTVALKASRTSRGVPLLEDIPIAGALFRPLPSAESSLQQNLIMAQATIFPTLFDLMGLRWAPALVDLDPMRLSNAEFVVRGRHRVLQNRVYDFASERVDEFLRIPDGNRRPDLYRSQETVPYAHPNGYRGPGLDLHDSELQEGYAPRRPSSTYAPAEDAEGSMYRPRNEDSSRRQPSSDIPRQPQSLPEPLPLTPPQNSSSY